MTIRNLIDALSKFDPDVEVVVPHEEPIGWWNCHCTGIAKARRGIDWDADRLFLIPEKRLRLAQSEIDKLEPKG